MLRNSLAICMQDEAGGDIQNSGRIKFRSIWMGFFSFTSITPRVAQFLTDQGFQRGGWRKKIARRSGDSIWERSYSKSSLRKTDRQSFWRLHKGTFQHYVCANCSKNKRKTFICYYNDRSQKSKSARTALEDIEAEFMKSLRVHQA